MMSDMPDTVEYYEEEALPPCASNMPDVFHIDPESAEFAAIIDKIADCALTLKKTHDALLHEFHRIMDGEHHPAEPEICERIGWYVTQFQMACEDVFARKFNRASSIAAIVHSGGELYRQLRAETAGGIWNNDLDALLESHEPTSSHTDLHDLLIKKGLDEYGRYDLALVQNKNGKKENDDHPV